MMQIVFEEVGYVSNAVQNKKDTSWGGAYRQTKVRRLFYFRAIGNNYSRIILKEKEHTYSWSDGVLFLFGTKVVKEERLE